MRRMLPKALFVTPPSRPAVMRDYYCTSVAKAGYAWHPGEFLFQSAILAPHFRVEILDATAEGFTADAARRRAAREPVDLLFGLVGAADPRGDLEFLHSIPARKRVVSGEVVQPDPAAWLETHRDIDGAVGNFTGDGLLALFDGNAEARGVAVRRGGKVRPALPVEGREFSMARPRHELFRRDAYRMPLQRERWFASLLTDYGCPHRCAFCNTGHLGYRRRDADGIADELDALGEMGFREIYVKDMSFGAHRTHARAVLSLLSGRGFFWRTWGRVEDLTAELLRDMKDAGCRLVQIGVEHADEEILARAGKPYTNSDVKRVLADARAAGLDVGAHFVLGLPGETAASLTALEDFVARLPAAYISVNLYAPRLGAPLAQSLGGGDTPHDTTRGSDAGAMPREELRRARNRIYARFYGRPNRWPRLAARVRPHEVRGAVSALWSR
ncbi:radical SAM protein [bacterium]|nr:radical SAM protein [bacterium]